MTRYTVRKMRPQRAQFQRIMDLFDLAESFIVPECSGKSADGRPCTEPGTWYTTDPVVAIYCERHKAEIDQGQKEREAF